MIEAAGLMFVAYALASLVWAQAINWFAVANLAGLVGAFWLGQRLTDPKKVWIGFVVLVGTVAMVQIPFPLLNPNILGCAVALAFAVALFYNWYVFYPIVPISIYFSANNSSRTALLAVGVVLVVKYARQFPVWSFTACIAAFVWVMEVNPTTVSLYQRMGIWQDTLNHLTLFGTGWGTFAAEYATIPVHTNMTLLLAPHAYNDALEVIFELGVGSIMLWLLVLLCLEGEGPKLPVLAFGIMSLAYFPLYIPLVAQAFAFSLGHLARSVPYGTLASYRTSLPQHSRHAVSLRGN